MEGGSKKVKKKSRKRDKDLALTISKSGKIKKFNDKCVKTLGYSKAEVDRLSFFENLIPKKYVGSWKKKFDLAVEKSSIDDFKLPILTKNGHEIMFSWSSFPIKNPDGNVEDISIVGSFIDSWVDLDESLPGWSEIDEDKINKTGFNDSLDKLKIKNQYLKDENKYLKKKLKTYLDNFSENENQEKDFLGFNIYKISDFFGGRKKNKELNAFIEELDEREDYLNRLESKLMKEKKEFNKQKIAFINWRKKLEQLERELESRSRWIDKKKQAIENIEYDSANKDNTDKNSIIHNVIDTINDSAAIIQRGILKQVNKPLVDLLGYNFDEILDKSLFDFIMPESFEKVEKYYKNRLKGEKESYFNTTLLTKDDKKLDVKVNSSPTLYNGSIAQIVVFKKVD